MCITFEAQTNFTRKRYLKMFTQIQHSWPTHRRSLPLPGSCDCARQLGRDYGRFLPEQATAPSLEDPTDV